MADADTKQAVDKKASPPPDLHQLADELFHRFSRVECALKGAGFHKGDGKAEADWTKFANEIQGKLEADAELTEAIKYISAYPPKKQVVRKGNLEWEDVPRDKSKTHDLLLCVRRVRNNLFHGGKFNARFFMPERDGLLIRHSLSVLDACLRASTKLREAYDNWKWP